MKFVAKPEAGLSVVRSKKICAEVESMMAQKVRVTPRNLLKRAKPESSPLHSLFEWDDEVAGEKHRIDQARKYIASVEITVMECEQPVRAFYSVPVRVKEGSGKREFFHRQVVLNNKESLASVSADRYATLCQVIRDVKNLQLDKKSKPWATICRAIENNPPG